MLLTLKTENALGHERVHTAGVHGMLTADLYSTGHSSLKFVRPVILAMNGTPKSLAPIIQGLMKGERGIFTRSNQDKVLKIELPKRLYTTKYSSHGVIVRWDSPIISGGEVDKGVLSMVCAPSTSDKHDAYVLHEHTKTSIHQLCNHLNAVCWGLNEQYSSSLWNGHTNQIKELFPSICRWWKQFRLVCPYPLPRSFVCGVAVFIHLCCAEMISVSLDSSFWFTDALKGFKVYGFRRELLPAIGLKANMGKMQNELSVVMSAIPQQYWENTL